MHVVGMAPYEDFDLPRRNRGAVLALSRRFGFDDVRVVVNNDASTPPTLLIHSRQETGLLALAALAESLKVGDAPAPAVTGCPGFVFNQRATRSSNAGLKKIRARLQHEFLHGRRWSSGVDLANAIFASFHNRRHRHGSLGWRTPPELESGHRQLAAAPRPELRQAGLRPDRPRNRGGLPSRLRQVSGRERSPHLRIQRRNRALRRFRHPVESHDLCHRPGPLISMARNFADPESRSSLRRGRRRPA